jgi:hypothetical protein
MSPKAWGDWQTAGDSTGTFRIARDGRGRWVWCFERRVR